MQSQKEFIKTGATSDIYSEFSKCGFTLMTRDEVAAQATSDNGDLEVVSFMDSKNANCLVSLPSAARYWIFTDVSSLMNYVANGNELNFDNSGDFIS